ncbi:hypothetical protein PG990_001479 [Apiospora arundinis]
MTMLAPFLALPTELATAILTHLDVSDLSRLSRTCKNLHAFAQPCLLHTVTLAYNPIALPNQGRPFVSLLRLLVQGDNDRASLVRHLKLVCPNKAEVEGPLFFDRAGWWDENRLLFEGVLEDLQMPDRDRWRCALRGGNTEALIALVMAQCPGLMSLEVAAAILFANCNTRRTDDDGNWFLCMFGHLLGVRSLPMKSLGKLRRVTIAAEEWGDDISSIDYGFYDSWWRTPELRVKLLQGRTNSSEEWGRKKPQWKQGSEGENQDLALLLFYLPALEELSLPFPSSKKERAWQSMVGVGFGVDDEEFWPLSTPPRGSRLATLRIRLQYAPEATLEAILAAAPALRTLHVDLNMPSTTSPIDCAAIQRALRHVAPTLENLTLTADLFADEGCDPSSIGTLTRGRLGAGGELATGFPALKSLHTSLGLLFGQEASARYVAYPGDTDWWSDDDDEDDDDKIEGIKSTDDAHHDMMLVAAAELGSLLPRGLEVLTISDDLFFYDALPAWCGGKRTLGVLMAFATGSPISPRVSQGLPLPRPRINTTEESDSRAAAAAASSGGGAPWRAATPRLRALNMAFRDEHCFCWTAEHGGNQMAQLQRGCASQGLECHCLRLGGF